jgi:glycosyltransferase involved in cell wall biosynthesis
MTANLVVDLTMSLANRTAVYDIGRELANLAQPEAIRYWRFMRHKQVPFADDRRLSLAGKALFRTAMRDLTSRWTPLWPRRKSPMLFIDPIFATRTALNRGDIVLCHDVAPISNPEFYDPGAGGAYDAAYRRIQAASCGIVFSSEYTAAAFRRIYPGEYAFQISIPLYFRPALDGPSTAPPRAKPYVLMVGVMERRKNYPAAIAAFQESGLAADGFELVIVGPRGNDSVRVTPELKDPVVHLGYVETSELASLYRNAAAFFFPSLLEGFGVPALEAPHAGVMPIVSRGTILEEIVGPAGVLVDPTSMPDLARGLREAIAMSHEEKARRLAAIRTHQQVFSIERFRNDWTALLREKMVSR